MIWLLRRYYLLSIQYVQQLEFRDYDRSRPFWNLHLLNCGSGDSAIVFEVHHCIADGISLIKLAMQLMTDADGQAVTIPELKRLQVP